MKIIVLIILFPITLTSYSKEYKTTLFGVKNDSLFDQYISVFPDSTVLSIALINSDKIEYLGLIKTGNTFVPLNNKKEVFEIGSITKVFTSTLLSQLIIDGTIKINDPIEKTLPFTLNSLVANNSKITFKTLSNHTSGLPRMPDNFQAIIGKESSVNKYNIQVLKDYLKNNLSLNSEPGKEYLYSNFAYSILGYLMEVIEKTEYEKLLQDKICRKYSLNSTSTKYIKVKNKVVAGKDSLGRLVSNKELGVFKASGGILSNAVDLSRFIQANFEGDKVLEYQRNETYRSGNFGVALGWQTTDIGATCKFFNHSGGMDGYRSSMFMDVPSKTAVVILSNVSAFHPENKNIDKLAFELMKMNYIKNKNAFCKDAFVEVALKEGWGAHIRDSILRNKISDNSIVGVWFQKSNKRIITRTFTKDNKVQTDFYKDKEIDVWGNYEINKNRIIFNDIGGAACNSTGIYEYKITGDTLNFKEIKDVCTGRKIGLLTEWIRMKKQK